MSKVSEIRASAYQGIRLSHRHFAGYADMIDELLDLVARMRAELVDREWSRHHAAENSYCPSCVSDSKWWEDQHEHNQGCGFNALLEESKP